MSSATPGSLTAHLLSINESKESPIVLYTSVLSLDHPFDLNLIVIWILAGVSLFLISVIQSSKHTPRVVKKPFPPNVTHNYLLSIPSTSQRSLLNGNTNKSIIPSQTTRRNRRSYPGSVDVCLTSQVERASESSRKYYPSPEMRVFLTRILIILTGLALIPLHCYLAFNFLAYFLFALLAIMAIFVIYKSCDFMTRRFNRHGINESSSMTSEKESTIDQNRKESTTSTITTFRVSRRRTSTNSNNTVSPTASCSSASSDTITNLNRLSPLRPVMESTLESISQQHSSVEDTEPSSEGLDPQDDQELSQIHDESSQSNNNNVENIDNRQSCVVNRRTRPSLVRSDAISSDMFPLTEHSSDTDYPYHRQSSDSHEMLNRHERPQLRQQQSLPERQPHPHHMLLTGIRGTAAALNTNTSGSSESGSVLSEDDPIAPYLMYQQQRQQQQMSEVQDAHQYHLDQESHFVPQHQYFRRTTLGSIPRANTAPDCSRAGTSSRLSYRRAMSRQSDIPEEKYSSYSRSSLERTSISGLRRDILTGNETEESSPARSVQTDINVRRKSALKLLQESQLEQSDSFDRETNTSEGVQSDNISRSLSRQTTFSSTKEQDIQGLLRNPIGHSMMMMQSSTMRSSCGYLEIAHAYDAPSKKLQIEIREAGDLMFSGKEAVSSIYIKLTLLPIKKQKVKTKAKTISEEGSLVFGDRFTFSRIHPEEVIGMSCRIRVYSSEKVHKQHVLAESQLSFARSRPLQTETKLRLNLEAKSHYSVSDLFLEWKFFMKVKLPFSSVVPVMVSLGE